MNPHIPAGASEQARRRGPDWAALEIEPASAGDIDAIAQLRRDITGWLASKGSDQWQTTRVTPPERNLWNLIQRGEVYIVRDAGDGIIASVVLDEYADPEFWTPEDDPKNALYVHSLVVDRDHAGGGLGATILRWCAQQAAARGKTWLRLDAWKTNAHLHAYYERNGFRHVRTVDLPHRGSGALFECVAGES